VAERIVLHIGTMKSGTTYLQHILAASDEQLRASGWLYPHTWRPTDEVPTQQFAFYGLLGPQIPWVEGWRDAHRGAWDRLRDQVGGWDGPVIMSAEALVALDDAGIDTLLESLPRAPVDVVLTVRSLASVLPSSWQQHLRNGHSQSFDGYLGMIRDGRADRDGSPSGHVFWRSYDMADVLRRWGSAVGIDRCVVVTVPRSAPTDELWRRFREATGLGDAAPDTPPEVPRDLANVGATAPEALIVEAVNRVMVERGASQAERRARVRLIMVRGLLPRADRGVALRVPPAWASEVAAWIDADVDAIRSSGVRVVGDVDDLRADRATDDPAPLLPEEVATAAAEALLVGRVRRAARRGGGVPRRLLRAVARRVRRLAD
jgi:hypothetical protein